MRAAVMRITLCRAARNNPDGTYDLFGGGVATGLLQLPTQLSIVAFAEMERVPPGYHTGELRVDGPSGVHLIADVVITAPHDAEICRVPVDVMFEATTAGVYSIALVLAGQRGTASLRVSDSYSLPQ